MSNKLLPKCTVMSGAKHLGIWWTIVSNLDHEEASKLDLSVCTDAVYLQQVQAGNALLIGSVKTTCIYHAKSCLIYFTAKQCSDLFYCLIRRSMVMAAIFIQIAIFKQISCQNSCHKL